MALEQLLIGSSPLSRSTGMRQRHNLALRALDGRWKGNIYRTIAEGRFGKTFIPDRHDCADGPFVWLNGAAPHAGRLS
ncbi:hypothetical protein [Bradyrhizobium sp. CCBAU 21359]|uniref:hypothetical protein n=1 Tax=Bradyrhizobium sp. CCBAU 21359 TaxID=1325080 RepID=UPI0023055323|nr:hypothetical protein [Bradyrhizobium sp. CCBAU 21359]